MTKKEWLNKKVTVDEYGRPPSLADVPLTIMTVKQAYEKQGATKKQIDELWKQVKERDNA